MFPKNYARVPFPTILFPFTYHTLPIISITLLQKIKPILICGLVRIYVFDPSIVLNESAFNLIIPCNL